MKKKSITGSIFAVVALVVILVGALTVAQAGIPIDSDTIAILADKMQPAVVNISTTQVVRHGQSPFSGFRNPFGKENPFDEFFRRYFGEQPQQEFKRQSLGSGFIISEDGYIVTNNHVVENASDVKVILADKSEYHAEIIGRDPKTDIALIKIKPEKNLVAVDLGDSDNLKVGEWVVAIGNPFGLGHTVTAGIVSAKGRIIGAGPYDDFIQTDASINPGNSGGPLFDINGTVIGINTAIISGGQGIGFAIPINIAKDFIIPQLREKGGVVRGWLGVYIQPVTDELAATFGLDRTIGALVGEVIKGSPAEKAGLKRGDIILEFEGEEVSAVTDLPRMVAATPVGNKAKMKIFRDGDEETLTVKIGTMEEKGGKLASAEGLKDELGLTVQNLTPEIAQSMGLDIVKGVIISGTEPNGLASEAGLRRGDIILEVDRRHVSNVKEFKKALKKGEDSHLFLIRRGNNTRYVAIKTG